MLEWRETFVIKKKNGQVDCLSQTCRKENLPEHNTKHSSPQSNNKCFSQRPPVVSTATCVHESKGSATSWTIVIWKVSIHHSPETVFLGLSGFCNANVFSGTSVTGPSICVQLCQQMQNSGGGGSVAIKAEVNFEALCIFRRSTKKRPRGWGRANHAHTKTYLL